MQRLSALWTLAVTTFLFLAADVHGDEVRLVPGVELLHQTLYPNESVFYFLDDLDPSTSYELRISYPATMPTDFEMVIIDRPKEVPSNPTRRRLLNTERIRIDPPDTQISAGSQRHQCWVRVTARHTGVSFRPELQNPPVVYNIVVASLILGVPTDALGLVGVAVVGLVVVGWLGVPWFLDFLDRDPEAETPQEKND